MLELISIWKQKLSLIFTQSLIFILCVPSLFLVIHQASLEEAFKTERHVFYHSVIVLIKKSVAVYWRLASGPTFSMLTQDRVAHYAKTSFWFWLSFIITTISGFLVIRALIKTIKDNRRVGILFFFVFFFPFLFLLCLYPIRLEARYLSFAAPFFYVLLSKAVWDIKQTFFKYGFIGVVLVLFLFGDINMIALTTDPIHKEDYRGMVFYALQHAKSEDAVVGTGGATEYYKTRFKGEFKATYFFSPYNFSPQDAARFKRVWIMSYLDMHPETNQHNLTALKVRMSQIHFQTDGIPLKFGGEESLTAIYFFEAKSST